MEQASDEEVRLDWKGSRIIKLCLTRIEYAVAILEGNVDMKESHA